MQVRIIDNYNQKDVDRFVEFPYKLYANNKQWVPPLSPPGRSSIERSIPFMSILMQLPGGGG